MYVSPEANVDQDWNLPSSTFATHTAYAHNSLALHYVYREAEHAVASFPVLHHSYRCLNEAKHAVLTDLIIIKVCV